MRNQSKSLLNCVRSRDAFNYFECCGNQVPCPSKHCSAPWHTMNQFGRDLVVIWSWFGHVAHGPLPTTEGQPSQRRLTAAAPPTYPEVSTKQQPWPTQWQISHGSSWPNILALCWGFFSAHMLPGNNTKVSPARWSVHWLHSENVGWNSKFQTLRSQDWNNHNMSLWYWSCANQTSWFRPWHATRNVVSLVATENRPDFPRTVQVPPKAHLQLSSCHTFVDLATHILTTRMTAKGMQLCRRNSWRHFANLDQKTCIQMCVYILIY